MWYFSWILGISFIGSFAILNAMWFEISETATQSPYKEPNAV